MPACPTCGNSVDQVISQPPVQTTPSIPQAYDLQSVIQAIQQLTQGYNQLTGRTGNNNSQQSKNNTQQPKNNTSQKKPKLGRFVEQRRVTSNVKIYSAQDPATFVTVKQINALTFRDTVTGETWTWGR
jgi:hypothetical protein